MVTPLLRCHLLIGPPSSGKSTLAAVLAEQVGAVVIATDGIRAELYGDDGIQGPWPEVEAELHQRLGAAVAGGVPVIVDATHCQRPFRLALTQALELPAPVQWVGWWLTTPLEQCLQWNQERQRQGDPAVIERLHGCLQKRHFTPNRQEGFAHVETLNAASVSDLHDHCRSALAELEHSIHYADKRKQRIRPHRYSRLLDFERLLHLIRLLLEFPGLEFRRQPGDDATDVASVESAEVRALRASFRFSPSDPLPPDDAPFACRAAFALAHRHGACYGDTEAVATDLAWLKRQGFVSSESITTAVEPGPPTPSTLLAMEAMAGFPAQADRPVFQRQLSLLRHLIQNPFDRPRPLAEWDREFLNGEVLQRGRRRIVGRMSPASASFSRSSTPSLKENAKGTLKTSGLREHLLERLEAIDGVDYGGQVRRLDKDIQLLITPYGFRDPLPMTEPTEAIASSRGNRRGFGLGTALFTVTQLKEVHTLIKQSYNRLNDPTLLALQQELEERLSWGGIAVDSILPVRAFANRSIIDPSQLDPGTMAHPSQLEKVEEAILEGRAIRFRALSGKDIQTEQKVWPLQILFHNIAWYLAYQSTEIGRDRELLTVGRLDRLRLIDALPQQRPVEKARLAQEQLTHLCRRTGGIYLGGDAERQRQLGVETLDRGQIRSLLSDGGLVKVRFRCSSRIFQFFRESNNRYPPEQIRLSGPLAGDDWTMPAGRALKPLANDPAHPYPVELLLPCWTVEKDFDFRRWLFGFGTQIRIDTPDALQEEHRSFGAGISGLYDDPRPEEQPTPE